MNRVIFSNHEGEGIITEGVSMPPVIQERVTLGDTILQPGSLTDLNGFYSRSVKFLGLDAEEPEHKAMIFHIGSDGGLFPRQYFKVVYLISPKRIYITFSHRGGRDFHFINGQWK